MGASKSKVFQKERAIDDVVREQAIFQSFESSLAVHVSHYSPPQFPMKPEISRASIEVCKTTWAKILEPTTLDGVEMSGMTAFYTSFYNLLEVYDKQGKFESVLTQHAAGLNPAAAKGAILIRIINFALAIDPENEERTNHVMFTLGKSHNHKRIRPWQYSVFVQCLINTLSIRLGVVATNDVMNAWVNLFAFIMQRLLPIAIQGLVNESELEVPVTDEVASVEVTDEIMRMDALRQDTKIAIRSKSRSNGGSEPSSRGISRRHSFNKSEADDLNVTSFASH